ncbi:MAG: hypothetical protein AVDCRST_MAG19-1934 [uncultured Thermomicrobiales bacterium]|uniref:Uncharacterized protein n=1 Tax=uncultured Thermomicrobiales bacterium TaxID=1645740 RepID=A0A6J4UZC6_9BACT|nr:MAG: hypothetical protein AVDCRST_MAG19-1934 [uncultured Thermomicrobiales bacterium]
MTDRRQEPRSAAARRAVVGEARPETIGVPTARGPDVDAATPPPLFRRCRLAIEGRPERADGAFRTPESARGDDLRLQRPGEPLPGLGLDHAGRRRLRPGVGDGETVRRLRARPRPDPLRARAGDLRSGPPVFRRGRALRPRHQPAQALLPGVHPGGGTLLHPVGPRRRDRGEAEHGDRAVTPADLLEDGGNDRDHQRRCRRRRRQPGGLPGGAAAGGRRRGGRLRPERGRHYWAERAANVRSGGHLERRFPGPKGRDDDVLPAEAAAARPGRRAERTDRMDRGVGGGPRWVHRASGGG